MNQEYHSDHKHKLSWLTYSSHNTHQELNSWESFKKKNKKNSTFHENHSWKWEHCDLFYIQI